MHTKCLYKWKQLFPTPIPVRVQELFSVLENPNINTKLGSTSSLKFQVSLFLIAIIPIQLSKIIYLLPINKNRSKNCHNHVIIWLLLLQCNNQRSHNCNVFIKTQRLNASQITAYLGTVHLLHHSQCRREPSFSMLMKKIKVINIYVYIYKSI